MRDKVKCNSLVAADYPVHIAKKVEETDTYTLNNGHLLSPMVEYFGDMMPTEVETAHFQIMLPKKWSHPTLKPIVLHLAGTGDHGFWRRRLGMAKPLMKEAGVASVILENPYYGSRKPKDQYRSSLRNVSDIFIMGGCLIVESIAILNWLRRSGFGPIGVTGISMGGHNASLAGASWDKPVSIVPCLSWTTASCVFTQGVMSDSIPWDILTQHYSSFSDAQRDELKQMIESPEFSDIFEAGRVFAKELTQTIDNQDPTNQSTNNSQKSESSMAWLLSGAALLSAIGHYKKDLNPKLTERTKRDVVDFMRGVMDECTHLGNFSRPVDPELASIISASWDGYVPQTNLIPLTELWPGSTHKVLNCGHVAAIVWYLNVFRKAIVDSLELQAVKYYGTSLLNVPKEDRKREN